MQKSKRRSPSECAQRRAECDYLAGHFREALAAARRSQTAAGRYWTIRAANRLATESVARLETIPPSVELHLIRAEISQSRKLYVDAVKEIRAASALAPDDPHVAAALAEALVQAKNLDEALPLLERLTRDEPGSAQLLFAYGDALLQSQQLDKAIPVLEQAVRADPSRLAARASLGRAYVQV
jgi:predicted Zn-dependent protease